MSSRRGAIVWLALGAAIVVGDSCRGGNGCAGAGSTPPASVSGRPAGGALEGLPAAARVVVKIDFARFRASALWAGLSSIAADNPEDRRAIEAFAGRTGFDPVAQASSIVVAFPESAREHGEMGLVVRTAGRLDEARLVAYVRDELSKRGDDLVSFRRNGRTLWAARSQPTTAGFFPDAHTFVLGAGGWAEQLAAAWGAPAPAGAETNPDLVHLIERTGADRPLWVAAIVPAATRNEMAALPGMESAAGISRLGVSLDIGGAGQPQGQQGHPDQKKQKGVELRLGAEFQTRAQAEDLARRVGEQVREAKRSPQVLMLGLGPYLDAVSARASDVRCEITADWTYVQANELVERLKAFARLARGAAGAGAGGPAGLLGLPAP